jgi:hypothetical protein
MFASPANAGGLHLTWHLPVRLCPASAVAELGRQQGLDSVALGGAAVLIGFGAPDEIHLDRSVGRLADALAALRCQPRPWSPADVTGTQHLV